jgi:lysine 2,3-aminomutase
VEENQNWTNEFVQSFKNLKDLYLYLNWPLLPELESVAKKYPLFIPRSLASKIKSEGPTGVLAKEFLPSSLELDERLNQIGFDDPIGDKTYLKAPQLIHRYTSRALFTPTTICPVHCRYCFRKNELSSTDEIFQQDFLTTISYLKSHPEITEIIFTGGDPFTISNEKLDKYLKAFSALKTIKDIRFHSRYPVILPERIDEGLLHLLQDFSTKFRTVSVAIHANHLKEFDKNNITAIKKLREIKIQLLSQTVLLKDINDNSKDLVELFEMFVELGIRPYYFHHPDRVRGGMHFYVPIQKGRELYQTLRDVLPGWAIPQYIWDIPGGFGKVPAFNPESTSFSGQLISKNGEIIQTQEPNLVI